MCCDTFRKTIQHIMHHFNGFSYATTRSAREQVEQGTDGEGGIEGEIARGTDRHRWGREERKKSRRREGERNLTHKTSPQWIEMQMCSSLRPVLRLIQIWRKSSFTLINNYQLLLTPQVPFSMLNRNYTGRPVRFYRRSKKSLIIIIVRSMRECEWVSVVL